MSLVVISPEYEEPRELAVLAQLFAAGLTHYHVRKPAWSRDQLHRWLDFTPAAWRARMVLHQHHELAGLLGVGGRHWRDDDAAPAVPPRDGKWTSRSCHELATVRAALGHYDAVFYAPVFASISKPGRAPRAGGFLDELSALIRNRSVIERRTRVIALGGITPENACRALVLGFDGIAALGAVWQAPDPLQAFLDLQSACTRHAA